MALENGQGGWVIAIGRQYGSGGRDIGKKLAQRLGYEFYDTPSYRWPPAPPATRPSSCASGKKT